MKLTFDQLFGKYLDAKDVTPEIRNNAIQLVLAVNKLMALMEGKGIIFPTNPLTGSCVGGETLGGFRPQECPIGAPMSAHKQGLAVDLFDPANDIDDWILKNVGGLRDSGLYFEHPTATPRWSHWTLRAPKSGRRIFYP